ncbi:hypothetical protein CYLTODRAFT_450885 [Cylindrobasidium torrendii FP15055 ss-10]|uniref:DRBM domain-containing protein n=1 Tax=Cylindrobasidium torrendii FP15055 ss-10 TaxID=1314674 RepID=A0A0D7BMF8_9AGAR|nr:hypothetical protein CYLTODRAFT_450885 [Cylindrobasidium torrendii FP15055 ss-10]
MSSSYRNTLNNWAIQSGCAVDVDTIQTGPQNSPSWYATVLVNGTLCGKATAPSKQGAIEVASYHALVTLRLI